MLNGHDAGLRALDLFCGAGGATRGLQRAGFHVTGIDQEERRGRRYAGNYFKCKCALMLNQSDLDGIDFIWASPPCQAHTSLKTMHNAREHEDLIPATRSMLNATGLPYVIENVEGAPLIDPVMLCGTMFPGLRVLRHRIFEASFPIVPPPHGAHPLCHTIDKRKTHYGKTDDMRDFVQVTGGGNSSKRAAADAMGIDWMTKGELNQAIPPAYSEFIARAFLTDLEASKCKVA